MCQRMGAPALWALSKFSRSVHPKQSTNKKNRGNMFDEPC
ncbi:hypothetical protein N665_0058s0069 [Sinapis alba]|nr:hypothetical protein N665_0058s0069 [Sinapis alba]